MKKASVIITILIALLVTSCQTKGSESVVSQNSAEYITSAQPTKQTTSQSSAVPVATPVAFSKSFSVSCLYGNASIMLVNITQNDRNVSANFNVKNNSSKGISVHAVSINLYNKESEVIGTIYAIGRLSINANQFSSFMGTTVINPSIDDFVVDRLEMHLS